MQTAKFVTFIVWGFTAATGVSIALGVGSNHMQPLPHIADTPSASYSVAHMAQLFSPAAPRPAAAALPASQRNMKLLGIVYSSDSAQSRALLETEKGLSKSYAVGSTLPNGAHITAIAQRSVTLAFNATTETLQLPKSK